VISSNKGGESNTGADNIETRPTVLIRRQLRVCDRFVAIPEQILLGAIFASCCRVWADTLYSSVVATITEVRHMNVFCMAADVAA
jgi:hypothetical protein